MWICPVCKREFQHQNQQHTCTQTAITITEYILAQQEDKQERLWEVYHCIKAVLPEATEKLSWNMPTFWQGRNLIHFAVAKHHIGLYPGGLATSVFADRLIGYKTSKGSIQLPDHQPLPLDLIRDIAIWCGKENVK